MKKLTVAFLLPLFMLCAVANAQNEEVVVEVEALTPAGTDLASLYQQADATYKMIDKEAAMRHEVMMKAQEDEMELKKVAKEKRTTSIIYILGTVGALVVLGGAVTFIAAKASEGTAKPMIMEYNPKTTSGTVNFLIDIPEHIFMAEMAVYNSKKEKVKSSNIDNATDKLAVDFSTLEAGNYKVVLIGPDADSNEAVITRR